MTYFSAVAERIGDGSRFDIILNHTRGEVSFAPLTDYLKVPLISTFHNIVLPQQADVLKLYPKAFFTTVSHDQAKDVAGLPNFAGVTYNGLDPDIYAFEPDPEDYAFWIGQISRRKNPTAAIKAAQLAGLPIVLAGAATEPDYFEHEIKPLIDGKQVKYVGEVGLAEKVPLYQKAKVFLFPIEWAEPFGLVMIEAMSCGTPVIAYPNGAVREVIADNETGFLVDSPEKMAAKVGDLQSIDRATCRQRVIENFSVSATADQYLKAISYAQENS
jgi:glycosyltransferase involved in cell wall biosynthesis